MSDLKESLMSLSNFAKIDEETAVAVFLSALYLCNCPI